MYIMYVYTYISAVLTIHGLVLWIYQHHNTPSFTFDVGCVGPARRPESACNGPVWVGPKVDPENPTPPTAAGRPAAAAAGNPPVAAVCCPAGNPPTGNAWPPNPPAADWPKLSGCCCWPPNIEPAPPKPPRLTGWPASRPKEAWLDGWESEATEAAGGVVNMLGTFSDFPGKKKVEWGSEELCEEIRIL